MCAIAVRSSTQIIDYRLTQDLVDAEEFRQFVECRLLPKLMNFYETNPNTVWC